MMGQLNMALHNFLVCKGFRRGFAKNMSLSLDSCYDLSIENKRELVHPATDANAAEAVEALKVGKVIAVPTDTLYGFACDAWYRYILISSLGYVKLFFMSANLPSYKSYVTMIFLWKCLEEILQIATPNQTNRRPAKFGGHRYSQSGWEGKWRSSPTGATQMD